jgi:hypothetical protein
MFYDLRMNKGKHHYNAHLVWAANRGDGTARYGGYGREYRVVIDGKLTAAPAFRGRNVPEMRG